MTNNQICSFCGYVHSKNDQDIICAISFQKVINKLNLPVIAECEPNNFMYLEPVFNPNFQSIVSSNNPNNTSQFKQHMLSILNNGTYSTARNSCWPYQNRKNNG